MATKLGRTVPWEAPTHEVTWPFGHMALQDHVTSHYIFTTTKTMATTLGQIVTYLEPLLPLVKSSWKTSWQFKTIISSLPQCPWPPNLLGWWLTLMGSYHIVTWPLIGWVLHLHPLNLAGTWLWGGLAWKCFSLHRLLAIDDFIIKQPPEPTDKTKLINLAIALKIWEFLFNKVTFKKLFNADKADHLWFGNY